MVVSWRMDCPQTPAARGTLVFHIMTDVHVHSIDLLKLFSFDFFGPLHHFRSMIFEFNATISATTNPPGVFVWK
jgi:hypothetical protein